MGKLLQVSLKTLKIVHLFPSVSLTWFALLGPFQELGLRGGLGGKLRPHLQLRALRRRHGLLMIADTT